MSCLCLLMFWAVIFIFHSIWRQFSTFEFWWISCHSSFKNSWLMWIMWITLVVICTFREHLVNLDLVDWQEQKDQWSVDILLNCWTIHTIFWVPQSIRFPNGFVKVPQKFFMQYIISKLYPVWATVDELYLTAIIYNHWSIKRYYAEKLCLV